MACQVFLYQVYYRGAIGNIADRLFEELWLTLRFSSLQLPLVCLNIADGAIVVGVFFLMVDIYLNEKVRFNFIY